MMTNTATLTYKGVTFPVIEYAFTKEYKAYSFVQECSSLWEKEPNEPNKLVVELPANLLQDLKSDGKRLQ